MIENLRQLVLPRGSIMLTRQGQCYGFSVSSSSGKTLGANPEPYANEAAALDGARRLARVLADLEGL